MKKRDRKKELNRPEQASISMQPVQPEQLPDWQTTGYHMEKLPCQDQLPLQSGSQQGYPLEDQPAGVSRDLDIDPMGKTGEDSSIALAREEGVRNHSGSFWDRVQTMSQRLMPVSDVGPDQITPPAGTTAQTGAIEARPGSQVVMLVIIVVVVIACVGWFTSSSMLRIHSITVFGNVNVSEEWIKSLSGLKVNDSLLLINEDKVAEAINSNRYLKLRTIVHNTPDVQIHVTERIPVAYTLVRGIYYTLDSRGMVLEEYSDASRLGGLICVDKLQVKTCLVGQHIQLNKQETLDAYMQLMLEIKAMSLQWLVKELYLDDMEDICMDTTDGYYVRMGDATYLHGKLRAMTTTRVELIRRGLSGGTIDVTVRDKPTYMPPVEEKEFSWSATQAD